MTDSRQKDRQLTRSIYRRCMFFFIDIFFHFHLRTKKKQDYESIFFPLSIFTYYECTKFFSRRMQKSINHLFKDCVTAE